MADIFDSIVDALTGSVLDAAGGDGVGWEYETFSSTNLASAKYRALTGELQVTFRDGSEYEYSNVPSEVWEGLISAPSAGSYFYFNIRESYVYTQL